MVKLEYQTKPLSFKEKIICILDDILQSQFTMLYLIITKLLLFLFYSDSFVYCVVNLIVIVYIGYKAILSYVPLIEYFKPFEQKIKRKLLLLQLRKKQVFSYLINKYKMINIHKKEIIQYYLLKNNINLITNEIITKYNGEHPHIN